MKLDGASLALGVGIGVAIVTVTVVIFLQQPGKLALDNEKAMAAVAANNGTHFFMTGLLTEISDDTMIIDQTGGRSYSNDNSAVTVRLDGGAAFVGCKGDMPGENCEDIISNTLGKRPVYICALTRMFNGEFFAGKIWADESGCPFITGKTNE